MSGVNRSKAAAISIVAMSFAWLCQPSLASDDKPLVVPKPVPATGSGNWGGTVEREAPTSGRQFTPEQMQSISVLNKYFNDIAQLQGRFVQINPDKKQQKGKFYVQRPGKFRFDYRRPSRQVIISDGKILAIQDLDLKTEDVYGLENTPFRILLRKDVNVLRDAKILAVEQSPTQIAVSLADKDPDAPGEITIYLAVNPKIELAGWVTRDIQGGVTTVRVSNLQRPVKLQASLFQRNKLFLKAIE